MLNTSAEKINKSKSTRQDANQFTPLHLGDIVYFEFNMDLLKASEVSRRRLCA